MTITDAPDVAPAPTDGDDFAIQHFVCCDDKVAMCGQDVAGAEWAADGEGIPCPLCILVIEASAKCPVPGCAGLPITD